MGESAFISGADLVPVDDSNHIVVPHGCAVVQIALQKEPNFPIEKRYTINKDLWDLLPPMQQAGLMIHELLYTQALGAGARDSVGVRYLNALLSSGKIADTTLFAFVDIARKVPLRRIEYLGYTFPLGDHTPELDYGSSTFRGGPIDPAFVQVQGESAYAKEVYFDDLRPNRNPETTAPGRLGTSNVIGVPRLKNSAYGWAAA